MRVSCFVALLTSAILSCACTSSPEQSAGIAAIGRYGCGSCHTIANVNGARGLVGPPLTGIGSREYVAGMLHNSVANMATWIRDPKAVNPKTAMPKLGVNEQDAQSIAEFLEKQ